jgi:type I restriction enzyme S subunit
MTNEWPMMSLRDAGVSLLDCEHRTPPDAGAGYPYVAIPQIKHGRLDLAGVRRIAPEHFAEWTKKALPQANDVILSRRCNPGETAVVPAGLECALGQNLVLLRADGKKVYSPFLRWLVRGPQWWEQIGKFLNVGAVFDSLKCADIPHFKLSIPPIPEQRRITNVLGSLDDKIELNQRMSETLEAMARTLFRSWFVEFDAVQARADGRKPEGTDLETAKLFPAKFQDSRLGPVPKGWRVGTLQEVAEIIMGSSPPGETYNDVGIGTPLVNGPVEFGGYFAMKRKWTTEPVKLSQPNDLIFCVRGSTTGRRVVADDVYCLGRGVCSIRAKNGAWGYVHRLIDFSLERMLSRVSGSVFPNLNGPDLKHFEIVIPDERLIAEYQRRVESWLSLIGVKSQESDTLAELRDFLLPKLLSGQVSVR